MATQEYPNQNNAANACFIAVFILIFCYCSIAQAQLADLRENKCVHGNIIGQCAKCREEIEKERRRAAAKKQQEEEEKQKQLEEEKRRAEEAERQAEEAKRQAGDRRAATAGHRENERMGAADECRE